MSDQHTLITSALSITTGRTVDVHLSWDPQHPEQVTIRHAGQVHACDRSVLLNSLGLCRRREPGAPVIVQPVGPDRLLVSFRGTGPREWESVVLDVADVATFVAPTLTEDDVRVPDAEWFLRDVVS